MSWKSAWYGKRKVKLIAFFANQRKGDKLTWQELCDQKANGHRFNGGFGANIYDKLYSTGRDPLKIEDMLKIVARYTKEEAKEMLQFTRKPKPRLVIDV